MLVSTHVCSSYEEMNRILRGLEDVKLQSGGYRPSHGDSKNCFHLDLELGFNLAAVNSVSVPHLTLVMNFSFL